MPSVSRKSSMSPGELAICEDLLDSRRGYATDLLSNVEKVHQWHGTDGCPEIREGRTCTVCELCSTDGLLGATKRALVSYSDTEKHLQRVRASFGRSVPGRGVTGRETLFKNHLAKVVFFGIVTVGDTLRSQHATWQTRLRSELATPPSSTKSLGHTNTGLDNVGAKENGDMLLPSYPGARFINPETNPRLTKVSTSSVLETTDAPRSSMFVIFKRCLSSDCPCEDNRANAASDSNLRGACGSQVASNVPRSPTNSENARTSKMTAKSDTAIQEGSNHVMRSTTANFEYRSKGTGNASDSLAQIGEHRPLSLTSETTLLTRETETWIADPRVSHLRTQIARSDEACRALMEWCRAWTADSQLDPRRQGIGPTASLTHDSTMKDMREYLSALAHDLKTVEPDVTRQVDKTATDGSSGIGKAVQELRSNSEQEELKGRWLMAQRKRCKDRKDIRLSSE